MEQTAKKLLHVTMDASLDGMYTGFVVVVAMVVVVVVVADIGSDQVGSASLPVWKSRSHGSRMVAVLVEGKALLEGMDCVLTMLELLEMEHHQTYETTCMFQ